MTESLAARKNFFFTGPRSSGLALPGSLAVIAVTTGASYINLSLLYAGSGNPTTPSGSQIQGALNQFISVYADTANVGIVLGVTAAQVSGSSAPSLTGAGSVSSGVYTPVANNTECWVIPAGTFVRFSPMLTQDLFMGFVGSTNGYIRIYQSSASNA